MSTSGSGSSSPHEHSKKCFMEWMNLQQEDLNELLQYVQRNDPQSDQNVLNHLKDKAIQQFQDYMDKRKELAKNDVSCYFAPTWISSLENSLLWVAGCRPSAFIRLLYALCGSHLEKNLAQFIQGGERSNDNLGSLTWKQLNSVNELHQRIMKLEDKLSSQHASLQEDVADKPIAIIAKGEDERHFAVNEVVNGAFKCHDKDMLNVLEEADKLRLSTLKELISILTPLEAVDYLAAGKKLHLCLHQWGKRKDHMNGRSLY